MTPVIMPLLASGPEVAFWFLAPIMVLGAIGMVLARKAVHSALCLAVVMISLAVQYAALEAPFLFAVQIIVYTGAILMLFLFVLMLVGVDTTESFVETIRGQRLWAAIGGIGLVVLLVAAIGNTIVGQPVGLEQANAPGNVQGIAALLFSKYVFAFEATAALLITAALGAMVLAYRERLSPKKTQKDLAGDRMRRYADTGEHPGPLPTPGVFARHNAVDTPALLPDGSAAETSVSGTLRDRGVIHDAQSLAAPTARTLAAVRAAAAGEVIAIPASEVDDRATEPPQLSPTEPKPGATRAESADDDERRESK